MHFRAEKNVVPATHVSLTIVILTKECFFLFPFPHLLLVTEIISTYVVLRTNLFPHEQAKLYINQNVNILYFKITISI